MYAATRGPNVKWGLMCQMVGPGAHFKNTVLDVCSNQGTKREMGAHVSNGGSGHLWPPRWRRPCIDCSVYWQTFFDRLSRLHWL